MMQKMFLLQNVHFTFAHQDSPFFENLNATFVAGKLHFIQGKNGAGKSTLFNIIQGKAVEYGQVRGTFILDTLHISIENNYIPKVFGDTVKKVAQHVNDMLALEYTVKENLQLAQLSYIPLLNSLPSLLYYTKILDKVGIAQHQLVESLSGGQRQLLAIVMMLQKKARVLLLDEPTAALDEKNSHLVMETLTQLAQELELVVIIISHDQELVDQYANGSVWEVKLYNNKRILEQIK